MHPAACCCPPAARAESALQLREEGFRALKIRVDPRRLDEGIAAVAATRDAVGETMEIMVDLNQGWRMAGDASASLDPVAARAIAARLAELGVLWLEEPLAGTDLAGLAALRASHPGVRIAGGEMTRTFAEQVAALDADAFDVHQSDVVLAAGMSRTRTLAELALARNRWFTPHTWTNGIGLLANLAVSAGVGGGPFLEFPYDPPGWSAERRDFMLEEPVRVDAADGAGASDARTRHRPGRTGDAAVRRLSRRHAAARRSRCPRGGSAYTRPTLDQLLIPRQIKGVVAMTNSMTNAPGDADDRRPRFIRAHRGRDRRLGGARTQAPRTVAERPDRRGASPVRPARPAAPGRRGLRRGRGADLGGRPDGRPCRPRNAARGRGRAERPLSLVTPNVRGSRPRWTRVGGGDLAPEPPSSGHPR